MNRMYLTLISEILAKLNRSDVDPVHVLALLRCDYGTLDHLPRAVFVTQTKKAIRVIAQDPAGVERLAESYGLRWRKS